ncbi:MAG: tyrosine-protein phosphatase [Candidatus Acidiferrum sp.]
MRFFSFAFVLVALCAPSTVFPHAVPPRSSVAPTIAQKISVHGVPNAGEISDSLFRGAQPHLANLDELKKLGITTIIDLRSEGPSARADERARAQSLGFHFISIPVGGFSTPTSAQLAEFFSLVRETPVQKIFVHCQFGEDRTGVFVAAYRIAFEHWTSDQALSEMFYFGFHRHWHPSMITFIRALPERLQSDATLKAALGK